MSYNLLQKDYEAQLKQQSWELGTILGHYARDLKECVNSDRAEDKAQLPRLCRSYADTFEAYAIVSAKLELFKK